MKPEHRVLLIEDDPAIRRFVRLALARSAISLDEAASVSVAREKLATSPYAIVMTDLMLGDGDGLTLARTLRSTPGPSQQALLMILSAGLEDGARAGECAQLAWRVLRKPVGLRQLVDSIAAAVAALAFSGTPGTSNTSNTSNPSDAAGSRLASAGPNPPAGRAGGVADRHFGGRQRLYEAFAASVWHKLPDDIAEGDRLCAVPDAAALRRHAHNLKTVMGLLGHEHAEQQARALESAASAADLCAGRDGTALRHGWMSLRRALQDLFAAA